MTTLLKFGQFHRRDLAHVGRIQYQRDTERVRAVGLLPQIDDFSDPLPGPQTHLRPVKRLPGGRRLADHSQISRC